MMVCNTQNCWVSGHCSLAAILNTRKHNVSEMDLFSFSGGGRETPTVLGSIERAN
jgi:hypothetical protein